MDLVKHDFLRMLNLALEQGQLNVWEPKETDDDKEEKERTVVLVGDGSFGDTFPIKQMIRALASRGVTIVLDEYHTSLMCPCGTSELQDTGAIFAIEPNETPRRPRCHKTAKPMAHETMLCILSLLHQPY